jgi:hypothetical protein
LLSVQEKERADMRLAFWAVVAFLAGLTFLILSFVDLEIQKRKDKPSETKILPRSLDADPGLKLISADNPLHAHRALGLAGRGLSMSLGIHRKVKVRLRPRTKFL